MSARLKIWKTKRRTDHLVQAQQTVGKEQQNELKAVLGIRMQRIRIILPDPDHTIFHGSESRSRPKPSSLPPPLPSFFTLNLLPLLPHPSYLIHHPSPLTPFFFTPPPSPLLLQPLNSSPSYLIRRPSYLNTANTPLLPHHLPFNKNSSTWMTYWGGTPLQHKTLAH